VKKLIAIGFLFTMLLQAIPVLHFFSERSEIFYAYIDEDKPGETKIAKEKKELKDGFPFLSIDAEVETEVSHFVCRSTFSLPSPFVESLIRPPDTAC
jgi:hypothetical protein